MLSIISTVGTTVFGKPGTALSDAAIQFENSSPPKIEQIISGKSFPGQEIYQQALNDLNAQSVTFLRRATAEINAIEGIQAAHGVSSGNEFYFLASQTPRGMLAARILADFCVAHYSASKSEARKIDGLQIKDTHAFRLTGLPYLVKTVYDLLEDAKAKRLIAVINPTGGFKAAIPYLTLVGMLRQTQKVEVSCIHETSTELISLAGLPIALDFESIKEFVPVLEACNAEQADGIDRTSLAKGLGLSRHEPVEDHRLWSLFEQYDNDHYILSGLGSIALAELNARGKKQQVWLSKQAIDAFEKTKPGSIARQNYTTILNRIHDPNNRVDPYRHTYKGSDFPAYKYKGDERLFYYEHPEGYILILELTRHVSDANYSYETEPKQLENYSPYHPWEIT